MSRSAVGWPHRWLRTNLLKSVSPVSRNALFARRKVRVSFILYSHISLAYMFMGTTQLRVAITCTHELIAASIAGARSMHYSTSSRPLCSSFARIPKLSNRPNPSDAYGLLKRAPDSQRSFILSHLTTCYSSPRISSASACFASSISTPSATMATQATPQLNNTDVSYL